MRTVNIGDVVDHLSGYLQSVKNGEELVVQEQDVPIARILPIKQQNDEDEREPRLIASGALKMPEKKMDWDKFFRMPAGNVTSQLATEAVVEGRGDQ